jgi:plastocyanin
VDRGTAITVENRGGETHTFTRVAQFGGGFIDLLNDPNVPVAPECAQAPGVPQPPGPDNLFVPAGGSAVTPALTKRGTVRFQCCIHPWMHSEVTVK